MFRLEWRPQVFLRHNGILNSANFEIKHKQKERKTIFNVKYWIYGIPLLWLPVAGNELLIKLRLIKIGRTQILEIIWSYARRKLNYEMPRRWPSIKFNLALAPLCSRIKSAQHAPNSSRLCILLNYTSWSPFSIIKKKTRPDGFSSRVYTGSTRVYRD